MPSRLHKMSELSCTTQVFDKMPNSDEEVMLYRIVGGGITADIISFGGTICRLLVPDRNGKLGDVILGQDTVERYIAPGNFAAAVIGRVANRISKAQFEIDGATYKLVPNFGEDICHGGIGNYARYNFSGVPFNNGYQAGVVLTSTDRGEGGFPGTVELEVTYALDNDGNLSLHYVARPDHDTPINLTNHAFFNLGGHESGSVGDHIMQLNSEYITPNDSRGMTSGEILDIKGTDFDYTSPKPLQVGFDSTNPLFTQFGGFDMNYCISGHGMRKGGYVTDPKSGRTMEFYTDLPGVQVFTPSKVADGAKGKDNTPYVKLGAFCLETQNFPDAINISHFPNPIVKAGEVYDTTTIYRFPKAK